MEARPAVADTGAAPFWVHPLAFVLVLFVVFVNTLAHRPVPHRA